MSSAGVFVFGVLCVQQCCQIFSEELSYKRLKFIVFRQKLSYIDFFTLIFTKLATFTWQKIVYPTSNYRFKKITIAFLLLRPKIIVQLSFYRAFGNTGVGYRSALQRSSMPKSFCHIFGALPHSTRATCKNNSKSSICTLRFHFICVSVFLYKTKLDRVYTHIIPPPLCLAALRVVIVI